MKMRTLRSRLVLSQIVPFLLVIPLVGITLIYLLESQVLLPDLADRLTEESELIAQITQSQPAIWSDNIQAQGLADSLAPLLEVKTRLMFLDTGGHILASTDPADVTRIGELIPPSVVTDLQTTVGGEKKVRLVYGPQRQTDIADVLVPVKAQSQDASGQGRIVGIVRLTNQLTGVTYERFQLLRNIILIVLIAGLLVGGGVGLGLALNIERPLRDATQAIDRLAG